MKSNALRTATLSTDDPRVENVKLHLDATAEYRVWKATLVSSDKAYLTSTEKLRLIGGGSIDDAEALLASGFRQIDGKHVAADLHVSRRGFRRIIPEPTPSAAECEALRDLADVHLSGPVAAVFEAYVLGPLEGEEKPDVESLAKSFRVSPRRIYKYLAKARLRLEKAWRGFLDDEETRVRKSAKDRSRFLDRPGGFAKVSYERFSSPWPTTSKLYVADTFAPSIWRISVKSSTDVRGLVQDRAPIVTWATSYTTPMNTAASAISSDTSEFKFFSV